MNSIQFIAESNRIEGITRPPTAEEILEFERFMQLEAVTVEELQRFVREYQPGAILRDQIGLDVRVARYLPPRGGPLIAEHLEQILTKRATPYEQHLAYEALHPFTDGNGRSGRMLWAWRMGDEALRLGFLHRFYYQTLDASARLST